jgi:hypothetical protein
MRQKRKKSGSDAKRTPNPKNRPKLRPEEKGKTLDFLRKIKGFFNGRVVQKRCLPRR